jgi:hypothetical protein
MSLGSYVGCRRVVFVAQTATFCVVSGHVATRRWSCRRHRKMSCRQGVQNDTTFDDMSGFGIPTDVSEFDTSTENGKKSNLGFDHYRRETFFNSHHDIVTKYQVVGLLLSDISCETEPRTT